MTDATDLFLALTPERVLESVEAAGLPTRPVCYPLNSFENRVYEVELADRSRVVAKFYRPSRWTEAQIQEEHDFLAELAEDEIPVCPVTPFPDGSTIHQIDNICYCIFERRGGRAVDELTDDAARRLGMLTGRLHNVGARRPMKHRPALDTQRYIRRAVDYLADHGTIPAGLETRYCDTALEIARLADHALEGVPRIRIHADLHLGNILFRDGELRLLDFDDMATGPAVQDVWLCLPGRDRDAIFQRELFLEGYEQFRSFDRQTLKLIEPLRGLRLVRYAGWLARRWHDPAFKTGWPHFGTADYWQRETDDLTEQLAAIHGELPDPEPEESRYRPPATEELLSNKDYFFDWED